MEKSHIKTILIITIITFFICGGLYAGLFVYIKNQNINAAKLKSQGSQTNAQFQKTNTLKKLVADIDPEVQQLGQYILSSTSTVSFIESIETMAKTDGLQEQTNTIDSGALASNPAYENIHMAFTVQGDWNSIYYLLLQLENVPYKLSVDTFHVNTGSSAAAFNGGLPVTVPTQKTKSVQQWVGSFSIYVLKFK